MINKNYRNFRATLAKVQVLSAESGLERPTICAHFTLPSIGSECAAFSFLAEIPRCLSLHRQTLGQRAAYINPSQLFELSVNKFRSHLRDMICKHPSIPIRWSAESTSGREDGRKRRALIFPCTSCSTAMTRKPPSQNSPAKASGLEALLRAVHTTRTGARIQKPCIQVN